MKILARLISWRRLLFAAILLVSGWGLYKWLPAQPRWSAMLTGLHLPDVAFPRTGHGSGAGAYRQREKGTHRSASVRGCEYV